MRIFSFIIPIVLYGSLFNLSVYGKSILDVTLNASPDAASSTQILYATVASPFSAVVLSITSTLDTGKAYLHVQDPNGKTVTKMSWQSLFTSTPVRTNGVTGQYAFEAVLENASGTMEVHVDESTPTTINAIHNLVPLQYITGFLMIVIGSGFVVWWKRHTQTALKWFWMGAGLWTLGVTIKFAVAIPCNEPVLTFLNNALPHWLYLTIGSIFIGLYTGIFEIGITLLIAWKWREMTKTADRAVAVGIGAGSFEAILLGLGTLAYTLTIGSTVTVFSFLMGPVERFMTIFFHIASRQLTLYAVYTRKYVYFWWGFLLLTAVDSIAGWVHLDGLMEKMSLWYIESMFLPFVFISIWVIRVFYKKWKNQDFIQTIN